MAIGRSLVKGLETLGRMLVELARRRDPTVRQESEFRPGELQRLIRAPMQSSAAYAWDLETIRAARDAQLAGSFSSPVRMAASMRTDDALFMARRTRLAPQRALDVRVVPANASRGARIAAEADPLFGPRGVSVSRETLADLNGDLADHGVAVGYNAWTAREDGSRLDVAHHAWPLEWVSWDSIGRTLYTQVDQTFGSPSANRRRGAFVDITHGDGTWVVYSSHEDSPWRKDAAILSASMVWARHAFAARDWSKGSASHGNAKVTGQLPEGVPLQASDSNGVVGLSAEAAAFLALLQDIASLDTPVGISPAGSTLSYMTNSSRAWEVWRELMLNAEKAAARIYLGTDGILGAAGGAPGVDIAALFSVATTVIQGDLATLERGVRTGVIEPWCAVNFGDSSLAPRREYVIPDPDAQRVREEYAKNEAAFVAALAARKSFGLEITQAVVDELRERYGVVAAVLAATMMPPPANDSVPALRAA